MGRKGGERAGEEKTRERTTTKFAVIRGKIGNLRLLRIPAGQKGPKHASGLARENSPMEIISSYYQGRPKVGVWTSLNVYETI